MKKETGAGFLTLLGLIFITLKLCGVIDWAWFFVLLPFLIEVVIAFVVLVVILMLYITH